MANALVLDASAAVRALALEDAPTGLFEQLASRKIAAHAPDLIVAEVSSALSVAVRAQRQALSDARFLLGVFLASPLELHPAAQLAPAALEFAVETGLSAYDSFYAVLAAVLDLPLATADRRLADAVPGALLVHEGLRD